MSEAKSPEQIAAEAAAAAAVKAQAKEAKAAEKAAAKAAADAVKAEAKAKKDAEKAAAVAAKEAITAAKVAEKAAKEAEKAAKKTAMPEQNGVKRPKPGGVCAAVWDIADAISADLKQPAPIANVLEAAKAKNLDETTTRVQYARWKKFFGLQGRIAAPTAPAGAAATA
jgi:hypothetical protein